MSEAWGWCVKIVIFIIIDGFVGHVRNKIMYVLLEQTASVLTPVLFWSLFKLEQLECLRSEDTPRRLMITHSIDSHWILSQKKSSLKNLPKFQIFEFWNTPYTRHTFLSCLIRCANMKWIQEILLKIQSRHDSVHRRTDGQGETSTPPFNFVEAGGIINTLLCTLKQFITRVHTSFSIYLSWGNGFSAKGIREPF